MRSISFSMLISGCALLVLSGCGGGGDCGSGMFCPPAITAYAQVNGLALRSDGSAIVGKNAVVSCGDRALGPVAYDATDEAGNFEVRLEYAVYDTLVDPYPPRDPDESFVMSCRAHLAFDAENLLVLNALLVRFAHTAHAVVPTLVELREAAP